VLSQRARDLQNAVEGEVTLTSFNAANVSGMKASSLSQALLCQIMSKPKLPNTTSESEPICFHHCESGPVSQTMSPQTISRIGEFVAVSAPELNPTL
jgi:hypothetical protein